jgi:hypothetical protein
MNSIATVLTSAAVSTGLSGILVWLFREWIGERLKRSIGFEYDQKLEVHKTELKAAMDTELESHKARLAVENAVAVEQLKGNLQIAAIEHQIRYSRLHEQVARTVVKTYGLMRNLLRAARNYVKEIEFASDKPWNERRQVVADAARELQEYFGHRRLFFPKELANRIDAFDLLVWETARTFQIFVEGGKENDIRYREKTDKWGESVDKLDDEAKPLFESMENEFRSMLGIKSTSVPATAPPASITPVVQD